MVSVGIKETANDDLRRARQVSDFEKGQARRSPPVSGEDTLGSTRMSENPEFPVPVPAAEDAKQVPVLDTTSTGVIGLQRLTPEVLYFLGRARLFSEFEARHGEGLPEFRGDLTPYWEDGAGSSALETAANRNTADRLVQAQALFAMGAAGHSLCLAPAPGLRPRGRGAFRHL
jgi:hypothetical protein